MNDQQPAAPPPEDEPSTALVRHPLDQVVALSRRIADVQTIAKVLAKATTLPATLQNEANLTLVLLQGIEMGFTPVQAIRASYVVTSKAGSRVGYYSDALVALVRKSGKCRSFDVKELDAQHCIVECSRTDEPEAKVHKFALTRKEASEQKLDQEYDRDTKTWSEKYPWKTAPADMLRNRTQGRAVKAVFQDIVFGMWTQDELEDIEPREVGPLANVTPFKPVVVPSAPQPAPEPAITDAEIVPPEPPRDDAPPPEPPPEEAPPAAADDRFLQAVVAFGRAAKHPKLGDQKSLVFMAPEVVVELVLEYFEGALAGCQKQSDMKPLAAQMGIFKAQAKISPACAEIAGKMASLYNERSGAPDLKGR